MHLDEPRWWYAQAGLISTALAPAAYVYGRAAVRRYRDIQPYVSRLPVLCIGNLTAGGTGKTPFAIHLIGLLEDIGERPAVLSRGYGGRLAGPVLVGVEHTAADVGDEPLLLAKYAPTTICADRAAGAKAIEASDASLIVMDDGLQNPLLAKDLSLAVVDGVRGVGNGRVIPAGPLRAPLAFQLGLVQALVLNRPAEGAPPSSRSWFNQFAGPVLGVETETTDGAKALFGGRPLVAYAGIGQPAKFFASLDALGADVRARVAFADHHAFEAKDAERLFALAARHKAELIATEKDLARLGGGQDPRLIALLQKSRSLPIRMRMTSADTARLLALVRGALARARQRTTS